MKNNDKLKEDKTDLPYLIKDNFLYLINHLGEYYLVILDSEVKEIFSHAYNKANYIGFTRAFKNLYSITINCMRRQLKAYINRCPKYRTN